MMTTMTMTKTHVVRATPTRRATATTAKATTGKAQGAAATRRDALFAAASAVMLFSEPVRAQAMDPNRKYKEVCDPTEDGAECRARILAEDGLGADSYNAPRREFKAANASTNPNLTTYQSDTLAFVSEVERLLAMDVYDPTREKAIAAFQKTSNVWSSKYAPGGSSKTASGRAFYNALNQLAGHYSFNGLAPLPKSRLELVEGNLEQTRTLLAQGR